MGTRADNHDGSCREVLTGRHKGKWRVQFTFQEPTGRKRRLSRLFKTKTDAKTFLQSLRRGERIEAAARSREMTLAEWFTWLAENDWPESIADVTIGYRTKRFEKYVKRELGHIPLSAIDPIGVRSFFRGLRESGVREWQLIAIKGDLVRAFGQAITPYQRIPMSMTNPFRLPLPQPARRNAVALTPEEVKAALTHPNLTHSQRAMLGVLLLAGLRLGEMMALTKGQIRFDDHIIVVDRAVRVGRGGKQSVGLPKGNKTRNVVMCPTLRRSLEVLASDLAPDAYLWRSAMANIPRMKKLVYASWRALRKAADLPADMSPHDCRLTHINIIEKLMPSVSATTLKEHVGHAASGVTEANYTRPLTSAQEILRREMERHFGEAV